MFENPRRGRQARNFPTNATKILDLKWSSEQIFSRKLPLRAPDVGMCGPKGYGFCAFFGLKKGIHFAHVGPESGMVFKRTSGAYERSYRFNSK